MPIPPLPHLSPPLAARPLVEADHAAVLALLEAWWAGAFPGTAPEVLARQRLERALLLPRLFFQHFGAWSEVAVDDRGAIEAFLVAFRSQTDPAAAYIHFVGVAPRRRGAGLGRALYQRLFARARAAGCARAEAVTSPGNTGSWRFHTRMGFTAKPGEALPDGRPVQRDYDGPGLDRIAFVKRLGA